MKSIGVIIHHINNGMIPSHQPRSCGAGQGRSPWSSVQCVVKNEYSPAFSGISSWHYPFKLRENGYSPRPRSVGEGVGG